MPVWNQVFWMNRNCVWERVCEKEMTVKSATSLTRSMKPLYKALMDVGFYWLEFILLTFINNLKTGGPPLNWDPQSFRFLSSFTVCQVPAVDPWYADEQVVCLVWWAMDMKGGIFDPRAVSIEVTFSLKKIFFFKKAYLHHPEPLCQFFAYSFVVVCTEYCVSQKWFCLIFCSKLFLKFLHNTV